ncbi:MAG: CapA family protein [Oscillospiraceae bacterium]|nr:CapA family protein [Oscillospiraceae bacterium]
MRKVFALVVFALCVWYSAQWVGVGDLERAADRPAAVVKTPPAAQPPTPTPPAAAVSAPPPGDTPAPPAEEATLVLGGDVLIDLGIEQRLWEPDRFPWVMAPELAAAFAAADLAAVNLEMPVSTRGAAMPNKEFTFRGAPEQLPFLRDYMGVDVVTLANNHTLDFGTDAMLDTLAHLDDYGIAHVGAGADIEAAGAPVLMQAGAYTVAFLGATRVVPVAGWAAGPEHPGLFTTYDPAALCEAIRAVRPQADYVIVYVHWGVERATQPESYQVRLARDYIDAGADAVVGAHPHVLQPLAFYEDKLIAYSLGNLIFTDTARDTMALRLTLTPDGIRPEVLFCRIQSMATGLVTDPAAWEARRRALAALSPGVRIDELGRVTAAP